MRLVADLIVPGSLVDRPKLQPLLDLTMSKDGMIKDAYLTISCWL